MKPDDAALRADELLNDSRWIHRIARSLLTDPSSADDLVQDAWVAALAQEEAKRDEEGSTRSWLSRVVRNLADKRWRTEARRRDRETSCARAEAIASTADLVARAEMQRLVVEAVLALPEPYRTTILRAHIEGLSSVEIARTSGVSDNTVRWRIQRGLSILRFELERRRGRDWLSGCALLLGPADRVAVVSAFKAAAAGMLAAVTPKVAAATAAVVAFAAGGAVVWHTSMEPRHSEPARVALADTADPAQVGGIGEERSDWSSDSNRLARTDTGKLVREASGEHSTELDGTSHPVPTSIMLGDHLRMAVEKAVGPDDASKLMTDSVLEEINDALAKAGIDTASLDARLVSGPPIALAIGVTEVDSPTIVLTKPRVLVGVRSHPAR